MHKHPADVAATPGAKRILFVFAWLVVGGEETEVRLLARRLDPVRYRLSVIACFRKSNMPEQTQEQLRELGVELDTTPYSLGFEDTIRYLAQKIPAYNLVVACQAVPDIEPAYEQLYRSGIQPPPLIEHGGLVEEARRGTKRYTSRYVGVCQTIRDAAASQMPDRPHHALSIPSMVDLSEFDAGDRGAARSELGAGQNELLLGWVGRLDRKKRVEDFLQAAAILGMKYPQIRFAVIGGPDAFMPEYEWELHRLAGSLNLNGRLRWTGDRKDVPRLLAGLDGFVWLARGEGMPHVISEAGAAGLAVIATRDNGTEEQIEDGVTGIFVPHRDPDAVAKAMERLVLEPGLRQTLGSALRRKVEREYSARVLAQHWDSLFQEVIEEASRRQFAAGASAYEPGGVSSVKSATSGR